MHACMLLWRGLNKDDTIGSCHSNSSHECKLIYYVVDAAKPDAKDKFMEAKAAFETLMDEKKRAEYDRRLRMVNAVWEGPTMGSSGHCE